MFKSSIPPPESEQPLESKSEVGVGTNDFKFTNITDTLKKHGFVIPDYKWSEFQTTLTLNSPVTVSNPNGKWRTA